MDLFFKKKDKAEKQVFYITTQENIQPCANALVHNTVPVLSEWSRQFEKILKRKPWMMVNAFGDEDKKLETYVADYLQKSSHKKGDITFFLSLFVSDIRNFSVYLDTLSGAERQVWKEVLVNVFMDVCRFEELTGRKVIKRNAWGDTLRPLDEYLLPFFFLASIKDDKVDEYGYRGNSYFVYLPDWFMKLAFTYFFPEETTRLVWMDELPADEPLTCMLDTEKEMACQFQVLAGLGLRQVLSLNAKGRLLMTVKKKVMQQTGLREYFPESSDPEYRYLRNSLTLFPLAMYFRYKPPQRTFEQHCRFIMMVMEKELIYFIPVLLPHVSGMRSDCLYHLVWSNILKEVVKILKTGRNWLSVDSLFAYLHSLDFDDHFFTLFNVYEYNMQKLNNRKTDSLIGFWSVYEQIFKPYVKAYLLMLNGLGMLDAACRDIDPDDTSYVDALSYVRLTPLGAFVLGLDKDYKPVEVEKKQYFELDENVLILRSLEKGNPLESLVGSLAEPIGGGRFKVSCESFLKSCKTETDVKNNLGIFKDFVSSKCPPVWEHFFQSVLSKCKPLNKVNKDDFTVYRISPENKELLHLLATDAVLTQKILRAEGYLILIKKENLKAVVDRLKSFGYLL